MSSHRITTRPVRTTKANVTYRQDDGRCLPVRWEDHPEIATATDWDDVYVFISDTLHACETTSISTIADENKLDARAVAYAEHIGAKLGLD